MLGQVKPITDFSEKKLALLGGSPVFDAPLHVGRPNIGDRSKLMQRIEKILDSKWLTNNGPYVLELEKKICDMTGAKHCIAVCNGTIGLELAIRALGMKGEVIIPSFTFIATAHALKWQEITPVFCDIDPRTHVIDPKQVVKLINKNTTGIIGVHLWGTGAYPEELAQIASDHNLKLLFDAAHAFGCEHRGVKIGNFGQAEVFSFHATKFVNSFEGGAIVTNDEILAARLRTMRNFGFMGYDRVDYLGSNGKMPEISAAMGITSMESMREFIACNEHNRHLYQSELSNLPGLLFYQPPADGNYNWQYVIVDIDPEEAPLTRDQLLAVLHAENVLARRYFYPACHNMEPYKTMYKGQVILPHTDMLTKRILSLPTGTAVNDDEIKAVCTIIRQAWLQAAAIRQQLQGEA